MNDTLRPFIEALREELTQYGEMLARLDEQQNFIIRRSPGELLDSLDALHAQGVTIQNARRTREMVQTKVTRALGLKDEASFREVLPRLPEDYRPLVGALVQENNELLVRVRQRARQNHLLIARSLDMLQTLISSVLPMAAPSTYTQAGSMMQHVTGGHALYEAVC